MATLFRDCRSGGYQIQFARPDGRRTSIRLGQVTKRQAENVKWYVEDLLACRETGSAPRPATADWVAQAPPKVRRRLERLGLVEAQERLVVPTLGQWLETYISGRKDIKPRTRINMDQVRSDLLRFFGKKKRLDRITPGEADDFRTWMKAERGLGEGTIRRRCKRAKQFFNAAVKKRIIAENPFSGLKCGPYADPSRFYFVTREEAEAVLEACPDAQWRLIFALCRYGGLRCPSEVLALRWKDVDWERMRFTVHAAKTAHHTGNGIRVVPIFPELEPHLRAVLEEAEENAEYVITRYRHSNANLRTYLASIICWADLEPWPKLFQNLRSTRETELAEEFPLHVVCAWIGNSQPIAAKHYLQVTDEHFRQAAGRSALKAAARAGDSAEPPSPLPSGLADAWAGLPEHVKAAILALASSSSSTSMGLSR